MCLFGNLYKKMFWSDWEKLSGQLTSLNRMILSLNIDVSIEEIGVLTLMLLHCLKKPEWVANSRHSARRFAHSQTPIFIDCTEVENEPLGKVPFVCKIIKQPLSLILHQVFIDIPSKIL